MKKLLPGLLLPAALILTGCGGSSTPAPAATANAAVMQVVDGLNANRADAPWHMLPAGYQAELNSVKGELAAKLDPELFDAATGVLEKLGDVLGEKKELILASPMLQGVPMRAEVSANYDQLVSILEALSDSAYSSHQGMKSTGIGKLLSSTGSELMEIASRVEISEDSPKPMGMNSMLKMPGAILETEAELVSEDGDSAVVKITTEGKPPEDMAFVRVDGKWIPRELADEFPEMISGMKESIREINITPEQKSKTMMRINMVNGVLDQIAATETPEELQSALMGVMSLMSGM